MKMIRSNDRWGEAHLKLRRLYDERVPKGMSQEEFGRKYGIGSQGMVSQYLSGHRPLNYEAAAKFAKGLGCKIRDISPEMDDALRDEILPVLGKTLRRVAMALLAIGLVDLAPSDANASVLHNKNVTDYCAQCVDLIHIVKLVRSLLSRLTRWMCVYAPTAVEYT